MPLVQLGADGWITLPPELREALPARDGEYLKAEVVDGAVTLRALTAADREAAWKELVDVVNRPKWIGPGPEPSEDELMEEVVEAIHEYRRENADRSL